MLEPIPLITRLYLLLRPDMTAKAIQLDLPINHTILLIIKLFIQTKMLRDNKDRILAIFLAKQAFPIHQIFSQTPDKLQGRGQSKPINLLICLIRGRWLSFKTSRKKIQMILRRLTDNFSP